MIGYLEIQDLKQIKQFHSITLLDIQMKKTHQQQTQLSEYFLIKRSIDLPLKLKLYFNVLQAAISQNSQVIQSKDQSKAFIQAFMKLNMEEKAHFICQNIKFIANTIFEKDSRENIYKILADSSGGIKNIETTASMSCSKLKITYWTQVKFKLDKLRREICFTSNKKNTVIYLKNYLARKSKRYKGAIVLDLALQSVKNDKQKYVFAFQSDISESIYDQIVSIIISCKNEMLFSLINDKRVQQKQEVSNINNNQALVFLNSKNINNYLTSKQKFLKYLLTAKFDFKTIYQSENSGSTTKVQHSQKNEKIFKMECVKKIGVQNLKRLFIKCFQEKNVYISSSEILQTYAKGKFKAVYEKYTIGGRSQQLIYIKQQIFTGFKDDSQEFFLFMKSIENIMIRNFMDYFVVKARPINNTQSKLIVVCSVNLTPLISIGVIKQFLKQLSVMLDRKQTAQQMKSIRIEMQQSFIAQQFHTVNGISFQGEQVVQFVESDEQIHEINGFEIYQKEPIQSFEHETQSFKKIKYKLEPLSLEIYNPRKNLMNSHYLFKEWVRSKEGGVICINQEIINEQKKMFKQVLTTYGNNILKGGSILNVSLPVSIFKKESHLYSVARDFCFAPLFFQDVTDRLQRIKMTVLLGISVGNLGISMDKPFNPILGQTLQVWIGGCPMYLEQISHHPPIGAYLFYGRGYRIYGQIQPKISFGMNNVKGYSQNPNYIQFSDNTIIELVYGKMKINGMLFGERTFDFDDRIYAYDKNNHIFAEINYGPRKKNIIMKNIEPADFVFGKIYQLKPEFLKKFNQSFPRIYPSKEYIISELSQFQGIWTGPINFDNKQYIDFKTSLPCRIELQERPLPSNSLNRRDYQRLVEGNLVEAQKQKEILQQFQRRDRYLRQSWLKKQQ